MVELKHDALVFSFPDVHRDAVLRIEFRRTLRLPDDDIAHSLPALGRFPLRHVHDVSHPDLSAWIARGGVMLPLHAADATWLAFSSPWNYPFALQLAVDRRNAVTGHVWRDSLGSEPQDYVVVPAQRALTGWWDGQRVRQFARPSPRTAPEESITSLQIAVLPIRLQAFERHAESDPASPVCYAGALGPESAALHVSNEPEEDPFEVGEWDEERRARCVVYLATSQQWSAVTGAVPPVAPLTRDDYERSGVPWLDDYAD